MIYLLEVCTFMFKEFNNKLLEIFHKYFNQQKSLHRYQTRHAKDYEIPHFKTNFARKTIRATGSMKWNLTEKHVKGAKTIKHFRNKIKKNIIVEYIYNIHICGGNVHVRLYLSVWFDIVDLVLYDIQRVSIKVPQFNEKY